ncbi:MAG: YwiC-like family protein [Calditrichaceae bacterium]
MKTAKQEINLRKIALPQEHGSWGYTLEPVFLGLLIVFSFNGLILGIAAMAAFMSRNSLKIWLREKESGKNVIKARYARNFSIFYLLSGLIGFGYVLLIAGQMLLIPMVMIFPLIIVYIIYDTLNQAKSLLPELSGAAAFAMMSSLIAMAGGWIIFDALFLWIISMGRSLTTTLYVRNRLNLRRKEEARIGIQRLAHSAIIIIFIVLYYIKRIPLLAVIGVVLLAARSETGILPVFRNQLPKSIGIQEFIFGAVYVILAAAGYHFSI